MLAVVSVALVLVALAWLAREVVIECWGRPETVCTVRNRWTGKITTRLVEYEESRPPRYVVPPDSARVLDRLEGDTTTRINPYARFRR